MALYAVKTSRSNTYGDMSESMFQSLKHPEVGIPADKVENSCDALISFFWNNRVYVFNPVEENISEGGRFQPPRRWLNRTTVSTALRVLVVDVSGSSELKRRPRNQWTTTTKNLKSLWVVVPRCGCKAWRIVRLLKPSQRLKPKL